MPRTKVVKKRRVTDLCDESVEICQEKKLNLNQKIHEVEEAIKSAKVAMRINHGKLLISIRRFYSDLRFQVNQSGLKNLTLGELRNTDNKENLAITTQNSIKEPTSFAKPKSVQRSLRKRSNSCSNRSAAKKNTITRSSSCDRVNRDVTDSNSKFKTPLNRHIPNVPVVTPKVNPHQPMSVLRRPRQGEFAMSMSGSPLMVSSVTYDDMVSVSIPLPDGRVLSILPTEGIDAADLSLDEETRKQLLKLRSNLTKCLQK